MAKMELFGIGFGEILLIALIALIVLGPERLPEFAASIGRLLGDLRRLSQELTTEFSREMEPSQRKERSETSDQPRPEENKNTQ